MSLGNRIKSLRKELGLTQKQFAIKIDTDGRQVSRYEADLNKPSIDMLIKIADLCEVSIDHLAYGQDKQLLKRTKIDDTELLELTRRIDRLKKNQRDKIKWIVKCALGDNGNQG